MDFAYEDIINRQRPVHVNDDFGRKYPQMPRLNRAKIFAPYAALRGFEGHIESKQVPYVARYIPDPEEERELNRRIGILYRVLGLVAVSFLLPTSENGIQRDLQVPDPGKGIFHFLLFVPKFGVIRDGAVAAAPALV